MSCRQLLSVKVDIHDVVLTEMMSDTYLDNLKRAFQNGEPDVNLLRFNMPEKVDDSFYEKPKQAWNKKDKKHFPKWAK